MKRLLCFFLFIALITVLPHQIAFANTHYNTDTTPFSSNDVFDWEDFTVPGDEDDFIWDDFTIPDEEDDFIWDDFTVPDEEDDFIWDDFTVPEDDFYEDEITVPTPLLFITTNSFSGKIVLSWKQADVFDSRIHSLKYRIYRSDSKTGKYAYLGTSTSDNYTDRTANAGSNYYYRIRALDTDSDTYSDYSNIVNRMCDLASPSVSLSVNTATGAPVVKWATVEGAAKYYIYRSTKKDSGYEKVYTGIKARTYEDNDAVAGTNYYYKVKAIHTNSSANSAYSPPVNRVCDLPKPTLSITLTGSGNPWLKWTAVKGATEYQVYRATSNTGNYTLIKTTVSATSFADRNTTSNKKYYYKVRAIHSNTNANSAYSSVKAITAK